MRRTGLVAIAAAMAAMSVSSAPQISPAILSPSPRVPRPSPSRKDKKRLARIASMGRHVIGRNRKLAKRLRRSVELGRIGTF